jgi:UDP-N-acetylmuramyl pentapeptide synthase
MQDIFKKVSRLRHHEGRHAALWKVIYKAETPLMRAARLHRATFSRYNRVVAVVGTYGKTTTTRAVRAALGLPEDRWTQLNPNCFGLVAWSLLRQSPLRRHAVVEIGIAGTGRMRRYVTSLQPNMTVVTCIGNEHIQAYESIEQLRSEKAEAVRCLPQAGTAILNGDDPNVLWMATQTRARILRFGFDPSCDVSASELALDWPHGTRFLLRTADQTVPMRVRLMGKNMIYPILAAVGVGLAAGRDLSQIVEGLEALPPTQGRVQPMLLPSGAFVLRDDYKSTVETVHAALDLLAELPARRRIVVLGGLDSPPKPQSAYYRAVGEHIARVAERVLIVGGGRYQPGLRSGGLSADAITHVPDIHAAITALQTEIQPEDVVLVKGRESQRMTRIVLALTGRNVRCAVKTCSLHLQFCDDCPLLERMKDEKRLLP